MAKGKKSVLLNQGRVETKPKARAEREEEMFPWFENLHSLVRFTILLGIAFGLVALPGFAIWKIKSIRKRRETTESPLRRKQFKKYFGISIAWRWFSKDSSDQSWKDKHSKQEIVIQWRIDEMLPLLAKDFLNACEREKELMKPYFGESEEKTNPKKDLKELEKIRTKISLTKHKFQTAATVAREGGFKVKTSAKECLEAEKEKVKLEEEES